MITVMGASGNTGKVVAEKLLSAGEKIRVIGRHAERLKPLRERGAETIDIVARAGDRKIFHATTRGHERIGEEGILARPIDRVGQLGRDETFGKCAAVVDRTVARSRSIHEEALEPSITRH